ncbi:MAG TPA: CoA transferase, partial [Marmoricola sp.]|nr:CoA transferase [Marmoricola sp.]
MVVISSPFGRTGPRASWQAVDRTLYALSGVMSRSGRPGDIPLLPPDGLAQATAAAQGAWTALVAFNQRLRTGSGQIIDLSHHEAVATGLDPAFGVQGSAAAGRSGKVRRDRPPADSYPIYPCADGYVRLCLLAKRQWQGMFGWLGEPEEFADPIYNTIGARVQASDRLDALIIALFADQNASDLVAEASRRGIPLAEVLTLGQTLKTEHFLEAGTVAKTEIAPGLVAKVPIGCIQIDGARLGHRRASPVEGLTTPAWSGNRSPWPEPETDSTLPFTGIRVLDLGVIVFGAEVGRAFADLGAEVIKIESLAFPDGLRQTRGGEAMNASFAWGQRNKKSLGLDLRSPEGKDIFLKLAAQSDVVLSNFKPGTLTSLGIDRATLAVSNPGIVVLESAAFSSNGSWARRLGYGPLVRAACGISSLWRYGQDEVESWDGVTVFPDHVAAKIAALGVLAALIARRASGSGAAIEVAQSDVVLHQLAALAAHESLEPGAAVPLGNRGSALFGGVFAAQGDDEWIVVDARSDAEVAALADIVGAATSDEASLSTALIAWAAERAPHAAMIELQNAGIPAAAMLRLPELFGDPQLNARETYASMTHPALDFVLPTENVGAPYGAPLDWPMRPAPSVGQH